MSQLVANWFEQRCLARPRHPHTVIITSPAAAAAAVAQRSQSH